MNVGFLAKKNIEKFGEYDILVFEDKEYSNVKAWDEIRRLARGLRNLGIKPGDRVIVLLPNCPEVIFAYQAIMLIGAVVVPVLFLLQPEEVKHILSDSGAVAAFTSVPFMEKITEAAKGNETFKHLILVGEKEPSITGAHWYSDIIASNPPEDEFYDAADDEMAALLYTSGTTGIPKGVMLSHSNLYNNAISAAKTQKLTRDDVGLSVLPLAHSYGLIVMIAALHVGPKGVLLSFFEPNVVADACEKHRATTMSVVPTMLTYLLQADIDPKKLETLHTVICAAAPLSKELKEEFESRFGCVVLEGYGLTEASPCVCMNRADMPYKIGSVGPPIEGVTVRIVDDEGNTLPPGKVGEICVKGHNVMLGYHNMPEETARTIVDGWLHTGDMGYLDEDGYLFLVDRKKDLIIRGGENIVPADVEEVLMRHPAVEEAAVIGVPHDVMGEAVKAFVVLKHGESATAEELIEFSRKYLAKYKTPKYVEFVNFLPKNAIGKVLKKELRRWEEEKRKKEKGGEP